MTRTVKLTEEAVEVSRFLMQGMSRFYGKGIRPHAALASAPRGHLWIVGVPGNHESILSSKAVLPELMRNSLIRVDRAWGIHPVADAMESALKEVG